MFVTVFFFNDTATTEIYTLSLHDALPISLERARRVVRGRRLRVDTTVVETNIHYPIGQEQSHGRPPGRSEEHTSELQSQSNLVCRLLLEKKKKKKINKRNKTTQQV